MAKRMRRDDCWIADAERLYDRVVEVFGNHDIAALTNSKNWIPCLPDPVDPDTSYCYMGRLLTRDIRQFILFIGHLVGFEDLREDKTEIFHTDCKVMGFVSGVPGYGKSTSLKAAFGNLYHFFLPNIQAKNSLEKYAYNVRKCVNEQLAGKLDPVDMKKIEEALKTVIHFLDSNKLAQVDEYEDKQKELEGVCNPIIAKGAGASTSVSAPRKRKRIMYINCDDLVDEPSNTIVSSLLLSHFDMVQDKYPDLMALIERPTLDGICNFLHGGKQEDEVYILVDDGNAMDPDDDEQSSKSHPRKFPKEQRDEAWNVLTELMKYCAIVVCASVRSWDVQSFSTPYKFFGGGGFTMEERSDYLLHRNIVLSSHDEDVAGCVPRLLSCLNSPKQLQDCYSWYQEGIQAYVKKHIDKGHEIYRIFSGTEEVEERFDGLSTRCFYRGPNGTAECLTNHLKSYALGCAAKQMKLQASIDAKTEMQRWLLTVRSDTNICRIGWNAETAGIIALSSLGLAINLGQIRVVQNEVSVLPDSMQRVLQELMKDESSWYFSRPVNEVFRTASLDDYRKVIDRPMDLSTVQTNLLLGKYASSGEAFAKDVELVFDNALKYNQKKDPVFSAAQHLKDRFQKLWYKAQAEALSQDILEIKPDEVRHFSGQFSWRPWSGKKVLHVPYAFNHTGADLYYEDEKTIVIIQLSVARNAKKRHPRTVQVMETLPAAEKRRRILLWVLAGVGWAYEKCKDYEDIQIPFGDLHYDLIWVDTRCSSLRMIPGEECLYCGARDCPVGGPDNLDSWVQCEECLMWVHNLCIEHDVEKGGSFICRYCQTTDV